MLFLLTLLLLSVALLFILFTEWKRRQFDFAMISVPVGIVACAYIIVLTLDIPDLRLPADHWKWTYLAPLLAALSGLAAFVPRLIRSGRQLLYANKVGSEVPVPRISFSLGLWIFGCLAAVYLAWTGVDHWRFFHGIYEGGTAGLSRPLSEVPCQVPLYRVQRKDDTFAEYRCPTFVALNEDSPTPFVPWPYYESGHSRQLKIWFDHLPLPDRTASP